MAYGGEEIDILITVEPIGVEGPLIAHGLTKRSPCIEQLIAPDGG